MLRYAVIFFLLAVIAAVIGFGNVWPVASEIGRVLFSIFIALFLVALLTATITHRRGY